jgi:two-component system chemotaxis sensor kinase CheA
MGGILMKRILLVEDDVLLGKAIVESLSEANLEMTWAKTGTEVFEILKSQTPDLVYLDIMLPDIDGYAVLKKMKDDANYQSIPVVMLTNLGQMSEISKAMEMGAADYIIKANIDLEKLAELTHKKYLPD